MTAFAPRFADSQPTIFLADADPATQRSIGAIAAAMGLACKTYATGQEFLDAFDPNWSGCLVLEIRVPAGNGLQIQKQLAEMHAGVPMIFLAASASVSVAIHAMRMGALNFFVKPVREAEFSSAVEEAVRIDRARHKARLLQSQVRQRLSILSEREMAVLKMLADCKSKVAMANALGVSVRTIEHHRTQIMRKLKTNSIAGLLRLALAVSGPQPPGLDPLLTRAQSTPDTI